jgi:hypothetical protein
MFVEEFEDTNELMGDDLELAMLDKNNVPIGYVIPYQEHILGKLPQEEVYSEPLDTEELNKSGIEELKTVDDYTNTRIRDVVENFPISEFNRYHTNLEQQYFNVFRVIIAKKEFSYRVMSAGSCLRLSKHFYGTTRHVCESKSGPYKFVSNISPCMLSKISVVDSVESGRWITAYPQKIKVTAYKELTGELVDKDPESNKRIMSQYNFSLLKTAKVAKQDAEYLVPIDQDINKNMAVAVHGYPTTQNITKWIKKTYKEDKMPDASDFQDFFNWNTKSVSIGKTILVEKGIFSVTCATCPGFSGAACTTIDGNQLLGFVIGTQKGNDFNCCISVHHPVFVGEYCKHVVPDLPVEYYERLRPWINRHREFILTACPSVLELIDNV